jgi:hypothetical protein
MNKIPLEATLVGAYRFLFTRIVSIIGTFWFPYLILAAVIGGCAWMVLPHEVFQGDFSHVNRALIYSGPIWALRGVLNIAALIIGPMILVNLMRHSLGLKQTTTFVYFSLGAPVWRMIGALLLAGLLLAAVVVVFVLAGVLFAIFAMPNIPHGQLSLAALITVLACAFIYVCFRLLFFLPAVVVAEKRFGLGRSWELGRGNFWRILVIYLLVTIPVWFLVGIALDITILPIVISIVFRLPPHPTPHDLAPLFQAILHSLWVLLPVLILAGIAMRALVAGAAGTAYNAVTGKVAGETKADA